MKINFSFNFGLMSPRVGFYLFSLVYILTFLYTSPKFNLIRKASRWFWFNFPGLYSKFNMRWCFIFHIQQFVWLTAYVWPPTCISPNFKEPLRSKRLLPWNVYSRTCKFYSSNGYGSKSYKKFVNAYLYNRSKITSNLPLCQLFHSKLSNNACWCLSSNYISLNFKLLRYDSV